MRSPSVAASSAAGSKGTQSGRRLVCTRWSGQGAPTSTSSGAAADATNSRTRGEVSTHRTLGRSLETAPRSAGRISASSAGRRRRAARGRPAEPRPARRARVDEVDRLVDDRDRAPVGGLGRLAPHDQAVLGQDDELQRGVRPHRLAHLPREREPGADVRDPGRPPAEALRHEALAVGGACQDVDAVRVRVVDVRGGDEGVQQRLDRAARHRRVDLAAREVGDHLLVAHRLARHQWQHLVEAQAGDVAALHRREVASRALDPHDGDLAARVVGRDHLGRGVPAAEVGHRPVGAQQAGREDQPVQLVGGGGRSRGHRSSARSIVCSVETLIVGIPPS